MDTCDCANGYVLKRMWVTESDVRYPRIYHSPDFFFDTASLTKSEARLTWQKLQWLTWQQPAQSWGHVRFDTWILDILTQVSKFTQQALFAHWNISPSPTMCYMGESPIYIGWCIWFQIKLENCICLSWAIIFLRNITI